MRDEEHVASPEELRTWIDQVQAEARLDYESLAALPMVEFPRSVRLPRPPQGWFDTAYAVTLDGDLAILRTADDLEQRWKSHLAEKRHRLDFLPEGVPATLSVFDGIAESAPMAFGLRHPFPAFDRLASGKWVIADNIAQGGKANASLVAPGGTISPLFLGDDIKFLQADPDGGFWIGYGDVGVFSGPHGMEQGGVVRFDATARPLWSMNADEVKRPDCIAWCDHCYALSISRDQRWAYTYTEFLLSRLAEGQGPRVLRPRFAFADAVAAKGDRILLVGGDRGPGRRLSHDRIVLLGPPATHTPRRPTVRWIATVHRGIDPRERLWTARGNTLHCVRGCTWHRLSIDEADALVPAGPWRS